MNPTVYQVFRDGHFVTVKSFNDPVGVVRGLFRIPGRYIPWQVTKRNSIGRAIETVVNGDITVTEIDIHLGWVKWCPAWPV